MIFAPKLANYGNSNGISGFLIKCWVKAVVINL